MITFPQDDAVCRHLSDGIPHFLSYMRCTCLNGASKYSHQMGRGRKGFLVDRQETQQQPVGGQGTADARTWQTYFCFNSLPFTSFLVFLAWLTLFSREEMSRIVCPMIFQWPINHSIDFNDFSEYGQYIQVSVMMLTDWLTWSSHQRRLERKPQDESLDSFLKSKSLGNRAI